MSEEIEPSDGTKVEPVEPEQPEVPKTAYEILKEAIAGTKTPEEMHAAYEADITEEVRKKERQRILAAAEKHEEDKVQRERDKIPARLTKIEDAIKVLADSVKEMKDEYAKRFEKIEQTPAIKTPDPSEPSRVAKFEESIVERGIDEPLNDLATAHKQPRKVAQ